MRVTVLSYSGTVGKTTLATHLFARKMPNASIMAIETVNETAEGLGIEVDKIRGEQFKEIFKKIILLDEVIIDVGASNVEAFLNGIIRYNGSESEIDLFVIPVTSGNKEQKEAITMVNTLNSIGISRSRICLLFNRVKDDVEEEFKMLLNFVEIEKKCYANINIAVYENELFDLLQKRKISLTDILKDDTDYRTLARSITSDGDLRLRSQYTDFHIMKSLSNGIVMNLDRAYDVMMSTEVIV